MSQGTSSMSENSENDPSGDKDPLTVDVSRLADVGKAASDAAARLAEPGRQIREMLDRISEPSRQMADAMKRITEGVPRLDLSTLANPGGVNPKLADIITRLGDQESLLDRMVPDMSPAHFEIPNLGELPPHPAHETNERLQRIEEQFAAMQTVAVQGAQIATALQAYAADFLSKFEKAAQSTDRAANKAVWVSFVAIALTVVAAILPLGYDLLVKSPSEAAAAAEAQQTIAQLRDEVVGLRGAQQEMANRLEAAMGDSDSDVVPVLEDIRGLLQEMKALEPLDVPEQPISTSAPAPAPETP